MDDTKIPRPFRIEPLCLLPCSLARTGLVARPCVAFLHSDNHAAGSGTASALTADEGMIPRLDAKEVAAVFSAPFHNFLSAEDEPPPPASSSTGESSDGKTAVALPPGHWYDGYWTQVFGKPWRVHNFHVPVNNQRVTRPRRRRRSQAVDELEADGPEGVAAGGAPGQQQQQPKEEAEEVQRFLVWGFTGRILVDAARVAYAQEPAFEHNDHYGDEALIERLEGEGALPEKKRRVGVGVDATKEVVNDTKI